METTNEENILTIVSNSPNGSTAKELSYDANIGISKVRKSLDILLFNKKIIIHGSVYYTKCHYDNMLKTANTGTLIRAGRMKTGLTQEELSHVLLISQSNISAIERGEGGLSIARAKLVEYFGVEDEN